LAGVEAGTVGVGAIDSPVAVVIAAVVADLRRRRRAAVLFGLAIRVGAVGATVAVVVELIVYASNLP